MRRTVLAVLAALVLLVVAVIVAVTRPVEAAPRPAATASSWAVVNVDGTLARGRDTVSSTQFGANGFYRVTFTKDVSQCAYVASGGAASALDVLDDAVVFTVAPALDNATGQPIPNAVTVLEYDTILAMDSYSSGFHLAVTC